VEKVQTKRKKLILGAVYIQPNVPQEAIEYFMLQMLGAYNEAIRVVFLNMNPDTETPILLCGDFNTDITQSKSFVNFMKSNSICTALVPHLKTLGNACIALTFTRNISVRLYHMYRTSRIIDLYSIDSC